MDKMTTHLIELSDSLDKAGNTQCADAIDGLLQSGSMTKLAQYVGVIGYILKQNRAMGNCIRKKRAASSDTSMQEVVLSCLKEYQDGQQYDNTEWTSKYAQVIENSPEHFDSAHVDLLQVLAEENEIQKHMERIKAASQLLAKAKVEDDLFKAATTDIEKLEKLLGKEGDADHRPFKVAAPPSQRSTWSRFWSPSWTQRGKDKDTQFEMDAVLESLMNIQSDAQQIKSAIYEIRHIGRTIPDQNFQQALANLTDTDWESTLSRLGQLDMSLDNVDMTERDVGRVAYALDSIWRNADQVHDELTNLRRNMYNLRLRDPIRGRGQLPSAVNEYSDLSQALQRLYANPLSDKALYYCQKLHGRLEDTLNARSTSEDAGFNEWVQSPEIGTEQPLRQDLSPAAPTPMAPAASPLTNAIDQIVKDPAGLELFVRWLGEARKEGLGKRPETTEAMNMLYDMLREQQASPDIQSSPETVQTGGPPGAIDVATAGEEDWNDALSRIETLRPGGPQAKINVQKLTKIADVIEDLDEGLAELLRDYISKQDEDLPLFPGTASLIKEETASGWKITQKKGGAVALNT